MPQTLPLPIVLKTVEHFNKGDSLLRIFEDIHNHIYANDGLSGQQAFSEFLEIMFIKVFDERKNRNPQFYIAPNEMDVLLEGKNDQNFIQRIKKLHEQAKAYFSDILESSNKINLKNTTLAYTVNKLQDLNLSKSSRDVKGLAFQKFVFSTQRNDRGQFFTPEQVVSLCVDIIKPKKHEKILDPACGSAGFLSQAMNYVYNNDLKESNEQEKSDFVKNNIFGIEINNMVGRVAKMRMILDGDGFSNIVIADSLSDRAEVNRELNKIYPQKLNFDEYFDIILTNPPFGTQGKVANRNILKTYSLAHKWEKIENGYIKTDEILNAQVPDILFIERCLDYLKVGGRMAIVLPNGDLENSSLEYVRKYIDSQAKILAVVHLPFDTFIPFGTGVKASVLFIQKLSEEQLDELKNKDYPIFFGKVTKIGYHGNKNGSIDYKKDSKGNRIKDAQGKFIIDEDVRDVIGSYNLFEKGIFERESDNCFLIRYSQLGSRFDADFYQPSNRELETSLIKRGAKRLGEVVEIIKRKARLKDEVVRYVELGDINTDYLEINSATEMFQHELPSRATYEIKKGDILTAVAGNAIGTSRHMSALVSSEFDGAIGTNGFRILKPKKSLDPYYFLLYLKSDMFLKQIYKFRTGAAIPSISDEDLQNVLIFVPNMVVQNNISRLVKESFEIRGKSKDLTVKALAELNFA